MDPNALPGYPLVIKHGNFLNTTHLWISSPFQPPEKILQITKVIRTQCGFEHATSPNTCMCISISHTHRIYIYREYRNQFKRKYKDKHFHNRCNNDNDMFHIFYNIMINIHHPLLQNISIIFSGSISPLRFCTAKNWLSGAAERLLEKGHNGTQRDMGY